MEENENGGGDSDSSRRCTSAILCSRTSLLLMMTGYALLGALLFKSLEGGGGDGDVSIHVQRSREDCLHELWLITERLNVLYEKNWTKLVTEELKRFERAVIESGRMGDGSGTLKSHWSFGGALLYSLTLLTTVGYVRLSPRTAVGKVVAIIYAIIGVPLMLILLSALGSMLAAGARKCYNKICCRSEGKSKNYAVGYHKAPSSPCGRNHCKTHDDSATIQIHNTPNHSNSKTNHQYSDYQEVPKKVILATVRATHTRGRCRQGPIKQMLTEPPLCPTHMHGTLTRNSVTIGTLSASDVEEADDTDENDHGICSHDTPSRIPLIWRPPESSRRSPSPPLEHPSPSVPICLVFFFFIAYVCIGAATFASTSGWSFLDATYFCFLALSTIGVGDKLPHSSDVNTQVQLLACCLYLFLGLVVVAMCFSLVHEEIAIKCRQFATNIGLLRH